ncbi:MAG: hypothetical protein JW395_1082 [Nitrospira sp.]|nr:hypothetical protein [Nitrospira sp.]
MLEYQGFLGQPESCVGCLGILGVLQQFIDEVRVVGIKLSEQSQNACLKAFVAPKAIDVGHAI